jgi:2-dehydro-3-deoxy-D-arabinonate dehydratase
MQVEPMRTFGVRVVRGVWGGSARTATVDEAGHAFILEQDDPLAALRGELAVVGQAEVAELAPLPPIDAPEIWCAGVTYERSRDARLEESREGAGDVYQQVYDAERPELFLKDSGMRRTVGPGGAIGLRSDSQWMVPEPELAVVLDGGLPVALTIGNDVSSRDIEGANPLYLPQAKVFRGSCAIGPALVVPTDWNAALTITLEIRREGRVAYSGSVSTRAMRRTIPDLVSWLVRDNPVPDGSVLLTGTGLVPANDFTLRPGDEVRIGIDGLGELVNAVGREEH